MFFMCSVVVMVRKHMMKDNIDLGAGYRWKHLFGCKLGWWIERKILLGVPVLWLYIYFAAVMVRKRRMEAEDAYVFGCNIKDYLVASGSMNWKKNALGVPVLWFFIYFAAVMVRKRRMKDENVYVFGCKMKDEKRNSRDGMIDSWGSMSDLKIT